MRGAHTQRRNTVSSTLWFGSLAFRHIGTCLVVFQAHKFLPIYPQLAERIRELPSSRAALQEATRLSEYRRKDWFDVNITVMDTVLEAKFMRHSYLRRMLLSTGDSVLIENSPVRCHAAAVTICANPAPHRLMLSGEWPRMARGGTSWERL